MILFSRAYSSSHLFLSGTKCIPLHKLRLAWNSFARLLDIKWTEAFRCPQCGDAPQIVVCDGTQLGCRKDLLQNLQIEQSPEGQTEITGSKHKDRVYIVNASTRKLLAQFATDGADALSNEDFDDLLQRLQSEGKPAALVNILRESRTAGISPAFKVLLKDLSRNGPASSLLQGTSVEDIGLLADILEQNLPLFRSEHFTLLRSVQHKFPVLYKFMAETHCDGFVPANVIAVIQSVLQRAESSFSQVPSDRTYLPPTEEELFQSTGFFPALPKLHR